MNEVSAILNIFGLLLDVAGVVVIFRFGRPPLPDVEQHYEFTKDGIVPSILLQREARDGLLLLVTGFGVQALGNSVVWW